METKKHTQRKILTVALLGTMVNFVPFSGCLPSMQAATLLDVQQKNTAVTGQVVDAKGELVIGASIRVHGSKQGVITDMQGNFRLNAARGSKITISYVGFESQTLTVNGNTVRVTLNEYQNMLNDVQVVAYGTQKKVSVTGAISSIGGDQLTKTPVSSVTNVLAGQLSGVSSVQYSGEPGSDQADLYIRGKSTFASGGATPLIQIDGVTGDMADLAFIDPNEIESINVLKDASATAVFGVEGANGVILVTTKRGKEGKAKISISSTESLVMATDPVKTMGSYEYATFFNQMNRGDGSPEQFSPEIVQKFKDGSDPIRFPSTDWIAYCLKKYTFQSQNNINISGGTSKVRYFLSVGMMTQGGMFKEFDLPYDMSYQYKRFNYRSNLDMDLTKTTALSFSMSGRLDKKFTPRVSNGDAPSLLKGMYSATPFSSPGLVNGRLIKTTADYDDYKLPFTGSDGLSQYWGLGNRESSRNALTVALSLTQKLDFITKGLSFHIKGSYNSDFSVSQSNTANVAYYTPRVVDGEVKLKKNGQTTPLVYGDEAVGKGRDWYAEAGFNYARKFGDHNVTAMLLYNQRKQYYPSSYSDIPRGLVGIAGRITYDWKTRYLLEFNVGHNGSENFAQGHRFGWFPTGSAGWIISEEPFWKSLKTFISYFKIRGSVGLVGKDNTSERFYYTSDPYSSSTGGYYFGIDSNIASLGAAAGAKHNPNVGWEKSFKQDYGFDINMLHDRFKTSFDYYTDHRTGILMSNSLAPSILGFSMPQANLGKVDSWGWELTVEWNDKIGKDFRYWAKVNLSYNQNKIVDMREVTPDEPYMTQTGKRIGTRSLYQFYKLYYKGIEQDYERDFGIKFPDHKYDLKSGDAVYVDLNKDGVIDGKDSSRDIKSYTDDPEYVIGLNLGFSWKNWGLAMQWSGAWNVSRALGGGFQKPFYSPSSYGSLLKYVYDNTWTEDNPNPNAKYPRATLKNESNYYTSALYIRNSGYFRLKSMNLSYDFHLPFMRKIKLNQLQVGLSGYNLLTITKYIWGDPEGRATGTPEYPLTKTFALNLKLGF